MMRIADWIATRIAQETDTVFGVTGGNIVNVVDAFYKADLQIVPMHHEQAAAMAADGYARVSHNIGVCFATSGPGGQNLLTGLACSYYDRVPVLAIIGQVPSKQLKTGNLRQLGFQESDNLACLAPVAVYTARATKDNFVSVMNAAILIAIDKKGPAVVEVCDDVQREEIKDVKTHDSVPHRKKETAIDGQSFVQAIGYIQNAKRPVLIIGAGCSTPKRVYRELKMPKLYTWAKLDCYEKDSPLDMRDFGVTANWLGNTIIKHSDCLVCVGTRMDTHQIAGDEDIAKKCIMVNDDIGELTKAPYMATVLGDADAFLRSLLCAYLSCSDQWLGQTKAAKVLLLRMVANGPYAAIRRIADIYRHDEHIVSDAVIISDAGQTVAWTFQAWDVEQGQRMFTAFNHSPMGYSVPAAIGAYFAAPRREIVCITGDGGLMMNIQELANIGLNKWPIHIYVINNSGYGMIRQTQGDWDSLDKDVACGKASGLMFPNVEKLADCFGLNGYMHNIVVSENSKIRPKLLAGKKLWDMAPPLDQAVVEEIERIFSDDKV